MEQVFAVENQGVVGQYKITGYITVLTLIILDNSVLIEQDCDIVKINILSWCCGYKIGN